jgi:glycosyltransferase involved in cell wall biosynthesis
MENYPRITIVTPSFNQGRYIAETIESVLAQNYPNLEYIIMDGGSTDQTLTILKTYIGKPSIKIISEKDKGQADAINKGFQLATGEIYGFLNSDDTLLPGTLHRVAQEINPQAGRHVIMGRCKFIDQDGNDIGIEHPSSFESHQRVLEIWKGHAISQPSTFWTKEVWARAAGMRADVFHLDYDLFCRMSEHYQFHTVDKLFATYRLHEKSKTQNWTEADRLEDGIAISKQYWGPVYALKYWRLKISLLGFRINRAGHGRALLKKATEDFESRHFMGGAIKGLSGAILAPQVVFYTVVFPILKNKAGRRFEKIARWLTCPAKFTQTMAYIHHTDPWSDLWAGPLFVQSFAAVGGKKKARLKGFVDPTYLEKPLTLTISINDAIVAKHEATQKGNFELELNLQPESESTYKIKVEANAYFVPHQFTKGGDYRPLSWKVLNIELI